MCEEIKEWLWTYGWAILIVIIVAAALYGLQVFDPETYTNYEKGFCHDRDYNYSSRVFSYDFCYKIINDTIFKKEFNCIREACYWIENEEN